MGIKLIGLDLDRTTLNSKGKISAKTKETLEKAIDNGVHIVIATGRSFFSMPEDISNVKGLKYTINSNGAEIRNLANGEVIYQNCIGEKSIEDIHDYLKETEYMIEVFTGGQAYIQEDVYRAIKNHDKIFRAREYVMETRRPTEDIYEFMLSNKEGIENINIFFEEKSSKENLWKELRGIKNITVTSSLPDNLEIGGETTSKATAIEHLADMLDIKKTELMCCGDSPNDIEMLKLAEIAVAVANGEKIVKDVATHYTDSNDDDGVAKAIEKFVL